MNFWFLVAAFLIGASLSMFVIWMTMEDGMNMWDQQWVQQGWQCPICKRVYAPTTPMCWYCGNEKIETSGTTSGSCNHEYVNKGTAGIECMKCGHRLGA